MRCLIVFLCLVSAIATQTFQIIEGSGAEGWCPGFDRAPNADLPTPTTALECYQNCKASYSETVAIDFWDINHPSRHAGNICWCQDACDCLRPSLPGGGDGVLLMEDGTMRGPSCGYDMATIREGVAMEGWCRGSDIKLETPVNNHHQCFQECKTQHGSVAVDFWPDREGKPCFCQSECPCLSPSTIGGGDGYLLRDETNPHPHGLCYKMKAGIGAHGWCKGMDTAPDASLPTPTTAAQCFDNCKATHDTTIAVDFWDINHPLHNAGNICWCQDQCQCTMPSKSDGGDGILFVDINATKGESCGYNMKTVVEGNDNAICHGGVTEASTKPGGTYGCLDQCKTDGFHVATYFTYNDTACLCQTDCPCTTATESGTGGGYLFVDDTKDMPQMCGFSMTCGEVKTKFRNTGCCGNPSRKFQ